ncbi:MAG: ABC transporter ATP-binding protein [Planctomycetes bacterium]|nr:ABC transporter ATP-binding protein [Planctomycetota bacterium]
MIELSTVTRSYHRGCERIRAVNEVTFSVAPGEFVAIVGPSGSGKTTLLNLIGCVDKPDSGIVKIEGEATNDLDEAGLTRIRARKIGFVFQQFFLLPTLTALENVQLPAVFLRNGDRSARATELLDRVGLSSRGYHLPSQLSGGEMQRVSIARALINEPKLLLADEPTGSLDSANADIILATLRHLNAAGLTILMVTHNAELAAKAGRIIALKDGQIIASA